MTKSEKVKFIRSLVNAVRSEIIGKVPEMPEEWDGIELRQYIADRFSDSVIMGVMSPRRRRDYDNEILVRNL